MKSIKVCYVLDCTSSMNQYIEKAKLKIFRSINGLVANNPTCQIYVAFLGYRDFGEQRYELDFTLDHDYVREVIAKIEAIGGGGDQAEDVAGAYRWAAGLDWSEAKFKGVLHFTDAPNHGLEYHDDTVTDNYPEGHPSINLLEKVNYLAKKTIDLCLYRLHRSTDIMYELMKDEYKKVRSGGFQIVEMALDNL